MGSDHHHQESVSPAKSHVKTFSRIIAAAFLSLLLPLSFLLLARLSTARYYSSIVDASSSQPYDHNSFLTFLFLKTETALILSLLVSLITVLALANTLTRGRIPNVYLLSQRGAWILLFMMQVCLILGIHGTIDAAEIDSHTHIISIGGLLVVARRVGLVLGLHDSMVFWWRSVVKPVVDDTISSKEFEWVEKAVMAVAFGNLWWRSLRDEAEALVLLSWVKPQIGMAVGVEDVLGWCLYYLMVAIGVVRVLKGGAWIFTRQRNKVFDREHSTTSYW